MTGMSEPVYFLSMEIENYRCFKEKQVLDLSDGEGNWKKWTVILGDNGAGKSSLLELLAGAEMEPETSSKGVTFYLPRGMTYKGDELINARGEPGLCMISVLIGTANDQKEKIIFNFIGSVLQQVSDHKERIKELKCFGYGANRIMGDSLLSKSMNTNSISIIFEGGKLLNAEEWLLQLDYAASKESKVKKLAVAKRDQVKQILIDLLPDINDIRFTEPTKENLRSSVEFQTRFGWVSIHRLSLGYKTMVAWMVDLAARMFERYPDSDHPLAEPAIVLVDEIDLHLHPKWQRKIFEYLSDKFPRTQFIVTAHSPLVVQSAPADANIVLLRKEEDHVVIDNEQASVQNWRLDQILTSDLFGIESSRGIDVEKKLEERRSLLSRNNLSKEEKVRLEELNDFVNNLPTAYNLRDMETMSILQEAAAVYNAKKK
jgi:predicted ATP-binding protein involved in virulence